MDFLVPNETPLPICPYSFIPLQPHMLYYAFFCLSYHHMLNRVIASNTDALGGNAVPAYTLMSRRLDRLLSNIADDSMHGWCVRVMFSLPFCVYVLRIHLESYQDDIRTNGVRTSLLKEEKPQSNTQLNTESNAESSTQPNTTLLPLTVQNNLEKTERDDNFSTHFFMSKAVFSEAPLVRDTKFHSQAFFTDTASYSFASIFAAQHLAMRLQTLTRSRSLSPRDRHALRAFCRLGMDVIYSWGSCAWLRRRYSAFPTVVHLEGVIAILQCIALAFEKEMTDVTAFLVRHREHFRNCLQYFVRTGLELFSTPVVVQYFKHGTGNGTMKNACEKLGVFFDLLKTCCAYLGIEYIGFSVCCSFIPT